MSNQPDNVDGTPEGGLAEAYARIERARQEGVDSLDLSSLHLTTLPESITQLKQLRELEVNNNPLRALPDFIWQLTNLESLNISDTGLGTLSESVGKLTRLGALFASRNELTTLPESIGQLSQLKFLTLGANKLNRLPSSMGQCTQLEYLDIANNPLKELPEFIRLLTKLRTLHVWKTRLTELPSFIGELTQLEFLDISNNQITTLPDSLAALSNLTGLTLGDTLGGMPLAKLPDCIRQLTNLRAIDARGCELTSLPDWLGELGELVRLDFGYNGLTEIPLSVARLDKLKSVELDGNPLNPALKSAYEQGIESLFAYLRSLEEEAEPLYEVKLVLVGEGKVGKTTLLRALSGREPREEEPTTHGVSIDVHSMSLPHPDKPGVEIRFNAWDFGGQEVYRVTHQFFFSRRSVYLLVWEPRMGVQQCQVEDWLKIIRLRVGDDARIILVSTHARTGQRIARIDKPVFLRDHGSMIVDFIEVDSLTPDPATGEPVGIAELKALIAQAATGLEHMGMPFNVRWRAARDELIELGETQPRVSYSELAAACARHGLDATDAGVLARLMHDLGYVVYYGDDERLKDDVVLQPEWLTKAIGFVLEDPGTQERDGVLPDSHLEEVWLRHDFKGEPRYEPHLYPFFLRLMEKYDVSYRLEDGTASLVAQHVPQVRPPLPWLPEEEPKAGQRRLALVCVMDETPPGLVPWMIVRTHEYAYEMAGRRLHWQKGMFLRNKRHGEAMLEARGSEFHLYAEAIWPEYFMNILSQTLDKLIGDNWPGLRGRYTFSVPCRHADGSEACRGRFNIVALRQFLDEGDEKIRCQVCRTRQNILDLLFGFQDEEPREQLARIEDKLVLGFDVMLNEFAGLESRLANYVMAIMRAMANEAKEGPRLFDIRPAGGSWLRPFKERYRLRLWCEAENCQHPVLEEGKGSYEFEATREWVTRVAPYASFVAGVLKTLVPMIAPAVDIRFGKDTIKNLGVEEHLNLMKEITGVVAEGVKVADAGQVRREMLSEGERSGLLALHSLLRTLDPHQARLGLQRISTYTGDFLWLCRTHYELSQPRIPETIG